MGLTSALGIGRTALAAYQAALQVAGQNIANASTPGYTRSSARLAAVPGAKLRAGQLGNGVKLATIRRNISESVQTRLRSAVSDKSSAGTERSAVSRLEILFNPLGDSNLGSLLSEFFGAVSDLQNNPENSATRGIVVSTASTLSQRIQDIRDDLIAQRNEINSDITNVVDRGDEIATEIADLNVRITLAEAGSAGPASALRDQRDQLLSELSEFFEITVREQPSGAVNVFIGSEALVQFGTSFGLTSSTEIDSNGLAALVVRFKINNGPVTTGSGMIDGLITSRDTYNQTQFDRLNAFTAGLINEVNKVHSSGQGLSGFSQLTGVTKVLDSTQTLTTANNGITFTPNTGSFFMDVKDTTTGATLRTQINIDLDGIGTDTTLDSLAADINANVANVSATVLSNGQLELTATSGSTFTFSDDTSGVLAALGVNTFFTGNDSLDIAVNPLIAGNPSFLAAAQSDFTGDGSNATALVGVQDLAVASLGGVSLNDHYNASMATLAVSASSIDSANDAAGIIFDSLTVQRESISGVNLDEEAVSLISFQRAYEGAARYMRVVDEMMQTLLGLVR
ncbi:MAG: flagellar hook-associated protein FlgK [Phycisphaerae bacterium]